MLPMNLSLPLGVFAIVASKVLSFSTTVVQSNDLGPAGYGAYGLVVSTVSLFSIVGQGSMGAAASNLLARSAARNLDEAGRMLGAIGAVAVVLALAAAAALAASASLLAGAVFRSATLIEPLRFAAVTLLVLASQSLLDGVLAGLHAFRARNSLSIVQGAVFLLLALPLTPRFGVLGALVAYTGANLVAASVAAFNVRRVFRERGLRIVVPADPAIYREIFTFVAPMLANAVLMIGTNWFVTSALARSRHGLSDVGVFSAATQARTAMIALPFLLQATYGPLMAAAHGAERRRDYRANFVDCFRGTLLASLVPAAGVMLLSSEIMWIFGKGFADGSLVLALSAALVVPVVIANLFGIAIQALELNRLTLMPNIVYSAICSTLGAYACTHAGAVGLVVVMVGAQVVQMFLLMRLLARIEPSLHVARSTAVALFLLAAMVVALAALPGLAGALAAAPLAVVCVLYGLANAPDALIGRVERRLPALVALRRFRVHAEVGS
ncbi:polysaccharide biosynthesis protein [mine drainage metagenome]|uniref:Polysaccharide biosynthesis protein n=1 Tax=mine drainage metagenome TaxID=410659 RepID=A0A1J5RD66_9ZZZZ